jgi:hypothetical protein
MAISLGTPGDQAPLDPKFVKLTSDSFLGTLYAKVYEYYAQANTFMSVKGKRFEKGVVHSELWQAMKYLRFEEITGGNREDRKDEWRRILEVEELPPSRSEVFLAQYFVQAVSKGDWGAIEDAAKLLKIMAENPSTHPGKVPCHYYVGMAAFELLMVEGRPGWKGKGRLPTQKEVKERAKLKRRKAEGKFAPPQRWYRIFNELGLEDLPL